MYIQVKLTDKSIEGSPVDLPSFLQGLQQESLYDLSWTDPALDLNTVGLYPVTYSTPAYDQTKQVLANTYEYALSSDGLSVVATQNVRAMTSDETSAYNNQVAAQAQAELANAIGQKLQALGSVLATVINNGVIFQSKDFQLDQASRSNIDAASLLATIAMMNGGGKAGDLRWANPNVDFGWIATDNSVLPMDAPTAVKFGQLSAGYYTELVFTARAMKDAIAALTDIASVNSFDITKGWPSSTVA